MRAARIHFKHDALNLHVQNLFMPLYTLFHSLFHEILLTHTSDCIACMQCSALYHAYPCVAYMHVIPTLNVLLFALHVRMFNICPFLYVCRK